MVFCPQTIYGKFVIYCVWGIWQSLHFLWISPKFCRELIFVIYENELNFAELIFAIEKILNFWNITADQYFTDQPKKD